MSFEIESGTKLFYENIKINFATKHEKEKILTPLFAPYGIDCQMVEVDTDEYGTFSGEVERTGSVRETLRKKINAAREKLKGERLFLASEGSFGPHPGVGFLQTDLESLLFFDQQLEIEIYAEFLCTSPMHAEMSFGPSDNFRAFLAEVNFPDHGVIVHPENSIVPVFKGLHSERAVERAMFESFLGSHNGRVVLATDLRSNHNPTRRKAIFKAGEILLEKLMSLCPSCGLPGFSITRGIPGLPCLACGKPSAIASKVQLECVKCGYQEERKRPDEKSHIEPEDCERCNP